MEMSQENFELKVEKTIQNGFLSLQLAIGHKLKLFEHLGDGESEKKTSGELAKAARLKERYVREWLGAMVTGGFVECDPSGKQFWFEPAAKAAFATDAIKGQLMVGGMIPFFAKVFDSIADCFKLDGPPGLPYSAYEGCHDAIAGLTDGGHLATLIPIFVPSVPGLQEKLERGIEVLDVGCGTGTSTMLLASRFPNTHVYGLDIGEEAIKKATERAAEKNLSNVHFTAVDAAKMPEEWTSKFDYAMAFDCIHDVPRPDLVLAEIMRVLKPGSRVSIVDIYARSNIYDNKDDPKAPFLYTASLFHCMPVSLYFPDGFGLGTMWGIERAMAMIKDAGFEQVELVKPPEGVDVTKQINGHYLCVKPLD